MADPITRFWGDCQFLSNFYMREVEFEGLRYPSSEHAFQAAKTLDLELRKGVRDQPTPRLAKKAGRALELRTDWESVKVEVMEMILRDKFTRHADLRAALLETGDAELIEGNHWHDHDWGVCSCGRCPKGKNYLGRLLMKIREQLRAERTDEWDEL
jgi:ribA/ribD-fused uncharacterized protein